MHSNFHGPRFELRIDEVMEGCVLRLQQTREMLAPDYQFDFDGRSLRVSPLVAERGNHLRIQVRDRHSGQVLEVTANSKASGFHLPSGMLQVTQ